MVSRLPNAELAIVERRKIVDYMLARNHPVGRAKAAFFGRFGFTTSRWQVLRDALLEHARSAPVAAAADTPFGRKYILEGPILAPDGRRPRVRAIWFISSGETELKFVTAYPLPGTGAG